MKSDQTLKTKQKAKGRHVEIVSEGHPALRQISEEVPLSEIGSEKINDVIIDMKKALASQSDGIGLAAPQIGIPLRIFLVSKKIFDPEDLQKDARNKEKKVDEALAAKGHAQAKAPVKSAKMPVDDLVFINPVLTKESREKRWMEGEGCLSVRWIYGKVRRSTKVTIRAYDENGVLFERGASGLLAHIFQHEVDHLNGILFIDKAKDLEHSKPDHE